MGKRSGLTLIASFAILLLTAANPDVALGDITVRGKVRVWNPIENAWLPFPGARVRIVLWEDEDWDTGDLETKTDANGDYSASTGNPWWSDGYTFYVKVFAETDHLEVQD